MHRAALYGAVFLLAACAATDGSVGAARIHLLQPTYGSELLDQCSRGAPKPGDSYFTPGFKDVGLMEIELDKMLTNQGFFQRRNEWRKDYQKANFTSVNSVTANDGFDGQFIGLIRGGHRYIYGNYYPSNGSGGDQDPSKPVLVCDGGDSFFGAEFNVETGAITDLEFNGAI